ncbi:MAG: sulfatase-like hydrolase/transferase [Gemmatimonadota bacterium]|nr:sulfatase-like hydrolase/transferase [Gemmatimonadota bacterium]
MPRPHVIYILSDEHAGQAMGHAGDPNLRTPNMDRMAAEGVSFMRARANCPVCTPSRGTIFSGRHAHAGPVQGFHDVYKPAAPSTATLLREAGYHTAYFGKWHCGTVRDQIPPEVRSDPGYYDLEGAARTPEIHRGGFQDWHGFEMNNAPFKGFYYREGDIDPTRMAGYQTDALTDMAIAYLRDYDGDRPLFLVLSVEPPHWPLEVPDAFMRFDPASLKTRPNFGGQADLRERLAVYYAMIENLDGNIGRLLDAVDGMDGFRDNTVTVYFSDHGDFMGSHGQMEDKGHPHEESVRVPAVFHAPGVVEPQGARPDLFSLVDMAPTTLGLAGVPVPVHMQGADFSPALRGEDFDGPGEVLLEMVGAPRVHFDYADWRGLVTDRWKYAYYETGHEVLFDLWEDPYESRNLADADPARLADMRTRLLSLLEATREPYFDVIVQHGVRPDGPALNISGRRRDGIAPSWDDLIRNA